MSSSKTLLIYVAIVHVAYVFAATIAPPPLIQTLNATNIGPEFVSVTAEEANEANGSSADAGTTVNIDKEEPEDAEFWHKVGMKQLDKTIKMAEKIGENAYKKKAKNIIIFIGDGMGVTTITAGRIYKGQQLKHGNGEEEMLSFDEFPYTGMAKTYNIDKQVPDSAGTATAIFCGVKTDYGVIGIDMTRNMTDSTQGRLRSIMDWAQDEGKRTGVVTTTRITHATPAATYARSYDRHWECDTSIPMEAVGKHKDIARQLIENAPGNRLNVIMGGGLSPMGALNKNETKAVNFEGSTEQYCTRGDNRNLTQEWLDLGDDDDNRVFVQTRDQLKNVDTKKVDHLMGLFRNNHITYSLAREEGEPSLKEMTEAAIEVLERGAKSKGYVLVVEGGRIDMAHHQNYAHAALQEVLELDMAVEAAMAATDESETLIIVTADHSHSVTLNGYAKRGGDILGFASNKNSLMTYETITYANGPGYWDHLANGSRGINSSIFWKPVEQLSLENRNAANYRHLATLPIEDETHGGEDVVVFANGPGASLVRGVFEQNYLAYVVSYAGCMGPAKEADSSCRQRNNVRDPNNGVSPTIVSSSPMMFLAIVLSLLQVLK